MKPAPIPDGLVTLVDGRPRLTEAAGRLEEAVLLADDRGRYLDANPSACKLTGFSRDELLAMSVQELTAPGLEPHVAAVWTVFQDRREMAGGYELRTKDGGSIAVNFHARTDVLPGAHISLLTPA